MIGCLELRTFDCTSNQSMIKKTNKRHEAALLGRFFMERTSESDERREDNGS